MRHDWCASGLAVCVGKHHVLVVCVVELRGGLGETDGSMEASPEEQEALLKPCWCHRLGGFDSLALSPADPAGLG